MNAAATTERVYVDDRDLARITRVPLATWQSWRHDGKGPPCFKVGRRVVYERATVEAWLKERFSARTHLIYVVRLMPDVAPNRVKVGYTSQEIEKRLACYRTASPTFDLVGVWPGGRDLEKKIHAALPGRIGSSEVFDVPNLDEAIGLISEFAAQERP